MASSDEDWMDGRPGAVAAEPGPGAAAPAPESDEDRGGMLAAPHEPEEGDGAEDPGLPGPCRRTRAQQLADARAAKAAKRARILPHIGGFPGAAPASSSAMAVGVAAPSEVPDRPAASSLATLLTSGMSRSNHGSLQSLLKPAAAHAEGCGIPVNRFREHLWCYTEGLFRQVQLRNEELVRTCANAAAAGAAPDPSGNGLRARLCVRKRKYDETSSNMLCSWSQGPIVPESLEEIVDDDVAVTKLFVVEGAAAMVFGKVYGDAESSLAVTWVGPTPLLPVERNSAECYVGALRKACGRPYDPIVEGTIPPAYRCCLSRCTCVQWQGGSQSFFAAP